MIPEISDSAPRAKVDALRESPPLWVRNSLRHPLDPARNQDFKTQDDEPLTHLLHEDSWLYPENWADINILLLARGEMKSTTLGWLETWFHDAYPQGHSYLIAPSKDQVIDFLEPIRQTYIEQANMDGRRVTDNKTTQVFKSYQKDDSGDLNPVLGRIQSDSGYSEDSVRGKHSQIGITDETQDLSKRVFNVFLPSIDQGLPNVDWAPTVFCIGTPKETGSFYHEMWERSDKRTWDAEEQDWIIQEDVDPYELSAEDIAELPSDIEVDEEDKYTVHGWHLDWLNSPLHGSGDIARAKDQLGEMGFSNEVLAQFYEPEDNLLTENHVRACFNTEYNFRETPYNEENTVAVVADWGGGSDKNASDTIIMAVEEVTYEDDTSEYVVLDIDFLDPDETRIKDEIKQYEQYLIRYDADVGLVDYGYGQQAMESLQHGDDTTDPDGYMETVSGVHYGNVKNKTDIKWVEDDGDKLFFTCDKSRTASRMVEQVRDDEWIIPRATDDSTGVSMQTSSDDGVRLIEQLTAPHKTLTETKSGKKRVDIETSGNQRDDSFDIFSFSWLAFNEVLDDDESFVGFAGTERPGHV